MIWSARPFYATAMLLASLPPLLAAQLARAPSAPAVVSDRMGMTLGEDERHHIVVTSLRSGGMADHDGITVGDQLTAIAGRPVAGLAAVRRLMRAPAHCATAVVLDRHGISYRAIIWQCSRTGVGRKERSHGSQDFAGRG